MSTPTQTTQISLTHRLTIVVVLVSVAVLAPIIGSHQQWITGPIVNATLFASAILLKKKEWLAVATVPSLVALAVGLLPRQVGILIPFIILGNLLLMKAFEVLKDKSLLGGVVAASFLKYLFLAVASISIAKIFMPKETVMIALKMFTWMQFATALAGGVLSTLLLKRIIKS
ncbi:hypothetical protein COY33_01225 [candidate division WWE3 bacterium CG_4_10_14_0_2_um_filter_42_7]|uniref:Iron hydrogenase n=1 Tax=candidate division WWE3 bacterium CG_4_10_14_0_2_um_filter_42_7 TaxID=1975073 RepID=A0A2M7TEC4_UNCKA|nr:MAG: hypothetical protein COY33_01225 [candidate division WWE3 bacterium CG_4_10_14_0_2_um_filter_42_7]